MNRVARGIGIAAGALVAVVAVAATVIYVKSESLLHKRYPVPDEPALTLVSDSAQIARGRHLFLATSACAHCHGADASGGRDPVPNPAFMMSPPNLTRGQGGIGGKLGVRDWERALRHGVRADGTSLMVMPSNVYQHLSDEDVAALIVYLQQVPPVDRAPVPTGPGPLGRALLIAGKMEVQVAPRVTPHDAAATSTDTLLERGRYLANISGCHGCHNADLTGGRVPGEPPDLPPARNITAVGIGSWSEVEFSRALREGKRPDGTDLNPFMPWQMFRRMSDEEIHAIWEYVRSMPAKPTPS